MGRHKGSNVRADWEEESLPARKTRTNPKINNQSTQELQDSSYGFRSISQNGDWILLCKSNAAAASAECCKGKE